MSDIVNAAAAAWVKAGGPEAIGAACRAYHRAMIAATPLPCPFCGGKPTTGPVHADKWFVQCVIEQCTVDVSTTGWNESAAIARWNTCTPEQHP